MYAVSLTRAHTDLVVSVKHNIEPLKPDVVLVVLQGDVQRNLWDMKAHAVKVTCLTDQTDQVAVEVDKNVAWAAKMTVDTSKLVT